MMLEENVLSLDQSPKLVVNLCPFLTLPSKSNGKWFLFSWHLYQVLLSLHYTHLSERHAAMLHCEFAAQLEGLGLWHWAAFVLLHIEEPTRCVQYSRQEVFKSVDLIAVIFLNILRFC